MHHFGWILERFPEARLIHVIRDGRDVVCSAREHGPRRWIDGRWVWEHDPRPIETYARAWVADTAAGLVHQGHPQVHEVRYEDLVERPRAALDALCTFLAEPFDRVLLEPPPADPTASPADQRPVFTSSVGRWRRDLSPADQDRVLAICGPRLRQLGYLE